MQSRIGNWGGSSAIRLPKMVMESLNLAEGQAVSLHLEDGALVIRSARPKYNLADLVEQAKHCERPESFDDGPMGQELL